MLSLEDLGSECKADALEGKLAQPCVGFVPTPAGHLCTLYLSTSVLLYFSTSLPLCTSVPLYLSTSVSLYHCICVPLYLYTSVCTTSTLWSWESHPLPCCRITYTPTLATSWNSFENSCIVHSLHRWMATE